MYTHLSLFGKKYDTKTSTFPIFKKSSSIHKNNPALIASIVLKKIYFHGICALSKQDAREAMRVVFSVLTKRICMHKTKFLMNIFKYCLKIILNSMNLQIATQLIIMFNF